MAEFLPVLLAVLASGIGAFGAVLLKKGSGKFSSKIREIVKNRSILAGVILYGISSIIFVYALKSGELSILYPVVSTTYIWTALLSSRFLSEKINRFKWIGIALIILGVCIIGSA